VHRALDMLPETPLRSPMPDALPVDSAALGWAEAWRGPCVHWVATDEQGRLMRVKITDPSFLNWPGLSHAVPGNIIPDFPVINKSFNLSYSGNDRSGGAHKCSRSSLTASRPGSSPRPGRSTLARLLASP
jgi:Ni,Fe-hydrogenase III large subunit